MFTPSIAAVRQTNASAIASLTSKCKSLPVAIFVGGTSGVGLGTASAFASHTKGNAHIIIVGRNEPAARSLISTFPRSPSSEAHHEFISCDVTLMKNVEKTTTEILSRYPKINYLVMSPGFITTKGRDESSEGIDRKLAVHYYARWKFVWDLLPGLTKAKQEGEEARVLSVLTAGRGTDVQGYLESEDWGMRKKFSQVAIARAGPTYMDLMLEEFSSQNSSIHFIHAHPGWVKTPLLANADSFFLRASTHLIFGVLGPWMVSSEEGGEFMLKGLLSTPTDSTRAWRVNGYGEDIGKKAYHGTDEQRKALWQHTVEEMKRVNVSDHDQSRLT